MLDRSLALRFKSRRGLPRVRTAHNRELIHRSAGEKLRSRSVSLSAARRLDRRRVYDEAGNVIGTHDHAGDFKEW